MLRLDVLINLLAESSETVSGCLVCYRGWNVNLFPIRTAAFVLLQMMPSVLDNYLPFVSRPDKVNVG